jgi:hypothetical protein
MNIDNNMLDQGLIKAAALNDNGLTPLPQAPAQPEQKSGELTSEQVADLVKQLAEANRKLATAGAPPSNEVVVSILTSEQYGETMRIGVEGSRRKGDSIMFGHKKARWIVNHIDEIKAFADKHNA